MGVSTSISLVKMCFRRAPHTASGAWHRCHIRKGHIHAIIEHLHEIAALALYLVHGGDGGIGLGGKRRRRLHVAAGAGGRGDLRQFGCNRLQHACQRVSVQPDLGAVDVLHRVAEQDLGLRNDRRSQLLITSRRAVSFVRTVEDGDMPFPTDPACSPSPDRLNLQATVGVRTWKNA